MTSTRRSVILIVLITIAAICGYGQSVEHWTVQNVFAVVGVGAAAAAAGITKSPREGALSDAFDGKVVSATSTTTTEKKQEVLSETNANPTTARSASDAAAAR